MNFTLVKTKFIIWTLDYSNPTLFEVWGASATPATHLPLPPHFPTSIINVILTHFVVNLYSFAQDCAMNSNDMTQGISV